MMKSISLCGLMAEGITGWGESVAEGTPFYSYETVQTAWHILRDFLIPSILGKDLSGIDEAISPLMQR